MEYILSEELQKFMKKEKKIIVKSEKKKKKKLKIKERKIIEA